MTVFHFVNCLALACVPYYFIYKYSVVSEYSSVWKCVQAGGIYVFTQLCKMLVLATFFPTTDISGSGSFDFIGELLKSIVDISDLVGLYIVLRGIPGKGHAKVLTAGVGWAGAELVFTRFLLLWIGARGAEFDWKYIQKCIDSNINLVQHITTVTLVWLWSRHNLPRPLAPIISVLLGLSSFKPFFAELIMHAAKLGPWISVLSRAVYTICLSMATLQIYAGSGINLGSY
ncbi:unnamed protein product [Bemisia tabaci]|uniref:BOS complex subunit TMEM147 n=1 Tax=Bemisia tabaci TaxID=7038 RepID=A0A9P0A9G5_BEMTA|nr:PREDICTED: transmembrane protein 147 [Bemisia tabaci]CAH0386981.1 unnamed protein product [Bemisia tabaci]